MITPTGYIGLWAISVEKPTQMEIRCPKVTQVKSLKPPITLINLQPACSAFSPGVKLPPYFKQFSKGFHVALKSAHLNVQKYNPTNFRIWHTFNVSNLSPIESEKLKKLAPAPTIPIDQLRAQIASFRHININNDKKAILDYCWKWIRFWYLITCSNMWLLVLEM